MGLFSPHKKHANSFNYIPRYFDPEKERREQRRAELRGERSDDTTEYVPGKYIRTQREARAARRENEQRGQGRSLWKMAAVALFVLLFVGILFPRLVEVFRQAQESHASEQPVYEARTPENSLDQKGISDVEWQAQPITIVPNDYTE